LSPTPAPPRTGDATGLGGKFEVAAAERPWRLSAQLAPV
jgi:hypothetical protein